MADVRQRHSRGRQEFRERLFGARKTGSSAHVPLIRTTMAAAVLAEVPLAGLSIVRQIEPKTLTTLAHEFDGVPGANVCLRQAA
jgi:hypothetical protein